MGLSAKAVENVWRSLAECLIYAPPRQKKKTNIVFPAKFWPCYRYSALPVRGRHCVKGLQKEERQLALWPHPLKGEDMSLGGLLMAFYPSPVLYRCVQSCQLLWSLFHQTHHVQLDNDHSSWQDSTNIYGIRQWSTPLIHHLHSLELGGILSDVTERYKNEISYCVGAVQTPSNCVVYLG